ncbi:bifunctional 4-hydroxy-2-oxoglutarate aldolase/2-dehydro-3-deoxy-phosphogluconate aldolase [Dactylosporangium sp. NPDC051484]|uniref:bifunctional 4-hydroxy-2-oxoglutarate aldolase/2-dehydro-3-deoxy-phosphogluconate aldolase n=1 Tax=Dactylosporangium sp. NPDC051484 TaxID=3154942 RepID=UPI00344DE9D6
MTVVHHTEQPAVVEVIAAGKVVPVVVLEEAAVAGRLADALVEGGLHCAEVTFRTAAAVDAIRRMAERPGMLVGAGTVLTAAQVDQAVDAGARFVVSPGFSAAVVRRCAEHGVPVFPGVASPSEIMQALDAGLDTVKFFPAEQLGGVPMVKALSAPFRSVRFIPTGGVNAGNVADYLAVPSVLAVGGTWMVAPDLLAARDWDAVTSRTRTALEKLA